MHGNRHCSDFSHCSVLEHYFQQILDIIAITDSFLPQKSPRGKRGKDFWTPYLTQLKDDSVTCSSDWVAKSRPLSGPTFERKKSIHFLYKAEIRRQKRLRAAVKSGTLEQNLLDRDYNSFQRDWKRVTQVRCPLVN